MARLDTISLGFAGLLDRDGSSGLDWDWPIGYARAKDWYRMSAAQKQDTLFYEWEGLAVRDADWAKLSLEECYDLMVEVFEGYKNRECPDLRTNRSSLGYRQKELLNSAAGYWDPQQGVIALAPSGQNIQVVLHECAHVLTTAYGEASHGEGYKKKYLTLLKRHAKFTPAPLPVNKQWIEAAYQIAGRQIWEEYRRR